MSYHLYSHIIPSKSESPILIYKRNHPCLKDNNIKINNIQTNLTDTLEHHINTLTNMQLRVSIVGAGPAGFALAADLDSRGTNVLVYSHPTHVRHANYVVENGCLRATGKIEGSTTLRVTFDMAEVIEFSKIIILTVPSTGHCIAGV
jgi:lactate dehydrogenase-like 2-hydroxyacid dehydrogenase